MSSREKAASGAAHSRRRPDSSHAAQRRSAGAAAAAAGGRVTVRHRSPSRLGRTLTRPQNRPAKLACHDVHTEAFCAPCLRDGIPGGLRAYWSRFHTESAGIVSVCSACSRPAALTKMTAARSRLPSPPPPRVTLAMCVISASHKHVTSLI